MVIVAEFEIYYFFLENLIPINQNLLGIIFVKVIYLGSEAAAIRFTSAP
jgi:hypothetical protein